MSELNHVGAVLLNKEESLVDVVQAVLKEEEAQEIANRLKEEKYQLRVAEIVERHHREGFGHFDW